MPRKLLVGATETADFADRRGYLLDLLEGLVRLGVEVRIAWLGDGPAPPELTAAGDLRTIAPPVPDTRLRVAATVARRLGPGFQGAVHDAAVRDDLAWLGEPDAVHLADARSVELLHYLRHPGVPVVTYIDPRDFSIAGLSGPDQHLLAQRTRRFVVADEAAVPDLLAAGVEPARIEHAPRRITVPAPPIGDEQRRRRRADAGLPTDRPVVAVAPVPDWYQAPDLTVSLAWELRRRRGDRTPHVLWYGMPDEGEAHWALQADLDRLGLDHVQLSSGVPTTLELAELADAVVVPSRPEAPAGTPDLALARDHLLPVLCWHDSPVADEVARWPGVEVPYPLVGPMADAVLSFVEDGPQRRRARNVRWRVFMAEVEQLAPLEVPAP